MKRMMKRGMAFVMTLMIAVTGIPANATEASTVSIPASAKMYRGHAYKVYKCSEVTWEKAQQYCEAKGGHLVTITSAGEATFVEGLADKVAKYDDFWIGAKKVNDKMKWVTGEKMSYNLFYDTSCTYAYLYCGEWRTDYSFSGYYYNKSCYICEWDTSTATVLPDQTKLSGVKKATSTSAILSWKKVSGAKGYTIYMKTGKNGKYKKIKDVTSGSITTYCKTKLKKGKTYYFRVRAYKDIYGERSYGELSDEKKITMR